MMQISGHYQGVLPSVSHRLVTIPVKIKVKPNS